MRKAVIFDLDGTLWDATGCAPAIWNRIFDKHDEVNFKMTKELAASLMGKTMEEIGDTLFSELPESLRREIVDEFGDEEVSYLTSHGARLFEGMEDVVQNLYQNYDLYIVSNCQDGYVPAFLLAHHMGRYFKDIEMSGRTGMNKGRNICLLMERNGILQENAVYIGDTAGDEEAARYAGIHFIWAGYGFGKAVSPDTVLTDIVELPSRLLSIWSKKEQTVGKL